MHGIHIIKTIVQYKELVNTNLVIDFAWHDNVAVKLLSPTVLLERGDYVHHTQQTAFYILISMRL